MFELANTFPNIEENEETGDIPYPNSIPRGNPIMVEGRFSTCNATLLGDLVKKFGISPPN
jgi:hypothetical protein